MRGGDPTVLRCPGSFAAERGGAEDALVAIWPDGHEAAIAQCTVDQHYGPNGDSNQKGSKLPAKTKKGDKAKKEAQLFLWAGYTHDQNPARLRWRDSRGWQVSYFIKGTQRCQMKPQSYEGLAADTDINDECVSTMMAVARAVEQGKVGQSKKQLFEYIDVLTTKRAKLAPTEQAAKVPTEPTETTTVLKKPAAAGDESPAAGDKSPAASSGKPAGSALKRPACADATTGAAAKRSSQVKPGKKTTSPAAASTNGLAGIQLPRSSMFETSDEEVP